MATDPRQVKKSGDFEPNWRHFRSSDIVTVKNPFDEDFTWEVFDDEQGRQVRYRILPGATVELTGGLVHTLGVKKMVDRMIQEDGRKLMIWDPKVRREYEEKILLNVKESASTTAEMVDDGEVAEVTLGNKTKKKQPKPEKKEKVAFPDAKRETKDDDVLSQSLKGLPKKAEVKDEARAKK